MCLCIIVCACVHVFVCLIYNFIHKSTLLSCQLDLLACFLSPYLTYMQYSVPGQPQDVRVEHANTSAVALMWSGATIRNNHVESYFVNYTAMDGHIEGVRGGSMVVGEPQMHCLLLGLDEYREYSVVVTGVNAMGRGAHSRYFTFGTPGKGVHALCTCAYFIQVMCITL